MDPKAEGGLSWRLRGALRALSVSLALSVLGTVIDLVVLLLAGSVILMTDLLHWAVDTVLEGVLLLVVYLASMVGRRFPWSVVVLESLALIPGTLAVLGVYVYFFLDYLRSVVETGAASYSGLAPLVATISGGAITGAAFWLQRRNYLRYGVELLNFDSGHALVDLVASAVATLGVVATAYTGSYAVELLFTFALMVFVAHSLVEVFRDNVRAVLGGNRVPEVEVRLLSRLRELDLGRARVRGVVARRFGSLLVVEVSLEVDSSTTVLELHRARRRVVRVAREVSGMVCHVDVGFYPSFARRRISRSSRRRRG